jgi:hypothetical protein
MVEECRESTEFSTTCSSRTMIHFLIVCWRVDVIIETLKWAEPFVAKVALITAAMVIVGRRCCSGGGVLVVCQELLGDDMVGIPATDFLQYYLSV